MADIEVNSQYLYDLRKQLREIMSDCQTLNIFFVTGAVRIAREPDVKTLQNLTNKIKQQVEEAVSREERERSSTANWDNGVKIGSAFVTVISSSIGKHGWIEGAERIVKRRTGKRHCFGMIMICVGKGGLPNDVHVVSISELARSQNREESEIIREIQQRGEWLFSPEVFLQMLDTIIEQLHRGELRLPILPKQLPAKLAIPREITVKYLVQIQLVPQLPPGRGTGA
jgi:hypothetical protein